MQKGKMRNISKCLLFLIENKGKIPGPERAVCITERLAGRTSSGHLVPPCARTGSDEPRLCPASSWSPGRLEITAASAHGMLSSCFCRSWSFLQAD